MATLITYPIFWTFVLAFLCFALSTAARLSHWTGGHRRTSWWASLFGGSGYLMLAASGLLAVPYLEGVQRLAIPVIAALFAGLGFLLVRAGVLARRCARDK